MFSFVLKVSDIFTYISLLMPSRSMFVNIFGYWARLRAYTYCSGFMLAKSLGRPIRLASP